VRLSPTVHGAGDHGFVPRLIDIARRTGISAFVGDGANRWPAVHRLDAARLFRLALEKAMPGARLRGVAEEGVPLRAIAEVIGEGLGVPVRSLTADEAQAHFDWLAPFVVLDNPTSSALTRKSLGWRPREPELLIDMRDGGYFSDVNRLAARG
jgi:nucleoside-diphosphate-sugar epimerase